MEKNYKNGREIIKNFLESYYQIMAENPTHPSSRYCGNYYTLGPGVRLESYTCPSRGELFETEHGNLIVGKAMLERITIDARNAIKWLLDYKDVNPDFIVDSKIVDLASETIKKLYELKPQDREMLPSTTPEISRKLEMLTMKVRPSDRLNEENARSLRYR